MNCLVLNPSKHLNLSQYRIAIINAMSELAIISNSIIKDNNEYFLAGNNYLHYISFLGCSPYLNFEPQKEISLPDLNKTIKDLNYIQFYFNAQHYCFRKTDFGIKAICPLCKMKIAQWSELIVNWENNSESDSICPQCHQAISVIDINWKKTAGFFQSAILFHGIQSGLAIPSDELLMQLEKVTNVKWQYFYG